MSQHMSRPNPFSEELLSAYLDGELSAEQRREVEEVLADSAEQRQVLDELRDLHTQLQQLPRCQLGDEFVERVLQEAQRRSLATAAPTAEPEAEFSEELLSAYLDDEASPAQRQQVETWLAANPEHQQQLDELQALHASLQRLPTYRLDDGFADRVWQAAQQGVQAGATEASSPAVAPASTTAPAVRPRVHVWRGVIWAAVAVAAAVLVALHLPLTPSGKNSNQPDLARTDTGEKPPDQDLVAGRDQGRPSTVPETQPGQKLPEPEVPAGTKLAIEKPPLPPLDGFTLPGVKPDEATFSLVALVRPELRRQLLLVYEFAVTAEGVENAAFANLLKRQGIQFQQAVAVPDEQQKTLLQQRFLKGVEACRPDVDRDEVQLFLVSCTAAQANAIYRDALKRPFGIASFWLNLTSKESDNGALQRVCDVRDVKAGASEAVQLLVNFAILSRTARSVGAFGSIRVDPVFLAPAPQPTKPAKTGPDQHGGDLSDIASLRGEFPCEVLCVVRHLKPLAKKK
jgi:anti-sigma factor RsiW